MSKNFRRKYLCLEGSDDIPRTSKHLFSARRNDNQLASQIEVVRSTVRNQNEQLNSQAVEEVIDLVDYDFPLFDDSNFNVFNFPQERLNISQVEPIHNEKCKFSLALFKLYLNNRLTRQ
ncbi:unnamed protein product, partial [Brachionus calyciflorus]